MDVQRHSVAITVDASGDGTGFTPVVTGRVVSIQYVKTDYANGIDFVVTGETSGIAVMTGTDVNASATFAPRMATHSIAGAASLYAATFAVLDHIYVAKERIKIVVAQGGVSTSGTFLVTVA